MKYLQKTEPVRSLWVYFLHDFYILLYVANDRNDRNRVLVFFEYFLSTEKEEGWL